MTLPGSLNTRKAAEIMLYKKTAASCNIKYTEIIKQGSVMSLDIMVYMPVSI